MPDTIRLWDALFADSKRFDFLIVVCAAIITTQRDHLLKCDFAAAIQLLQRPYTLGVERLLGQATRAYEGAYRGGLDVPGGAERESSSKREIAGIHAEEVEKALKKVAAASQETASRLLGKFRTWASAEKKPKSQTRMSPIRKAKEAAPRESDVVVMGEREKALGAQIEARGMTREEEVNEKGEEEEEEAEAFSIKEKETVPSVTPCADGGNNQHRSNPPAGIISSPKFIEPTNLFANADDDCDLFDSD
jgi:hypothetical protein